MTASATPADDVQATFSRSSGAGGQNVNKVSTKADIRFDVVNCKWMSQKLKQAVMQREAGRMNKQVCPAFANPGHRLLFKVKFSHNQALVLQSSSYSSGCLVARQHREWLADRP